MKIIIYFALSLAACSAFAQDEDREFARKTLLLKFDTVEDAQKWSLRDLDFEQWLKAVSKPDWTELHKSKTDEFYFAIYRSEDHLIFCENDRKDAYRSASISVRATDDSIAYSVWEKPSMWTILKYDVEHPSGGYGGQSVFTTWKIVDGFVGDIILNYRVGNDGGARRQVLLQSIHWNKKQNKSVDSTR